MSEGPVEALVVKAYHAGEDNLQADWEFALDDVLPEDINPTPAEVANYIRSLTNG